MSLNVSCSCCQENIPCSLSQFCHGLPTMTLFLSTWSGDHVRTKQTTCEQNRPRANKTDHVRTKQTTCERNRPHVNENRPHANGSYCSAMVTPTVPSLLAYRALFSIWSPDHDKHVVRRPRKNKMVYLLVHGIFAMYFTIPPLLGGERKGVGYP